MKDTTNKKFLKEAIVLLIATVTILSTVSVTANSPEFMLAGEDSQSQQTNTFDPDWIHFDDGTNADALGLTNGGTFEWAARFTPDELGDFGGYQISVVRHHHSSVGGSPFQMSGKIKIYEEGTSTKPGNLITSEPFEVTDNDWFDVELSEPVQITGDEDIWVSIEGTHQVGQFPAGMDPGPAVAGKGDWVCLGGVWDEIRNFDFNFNFNIWIELEIPSEPPETPQQPDGPTDGIVGVEYTFSTNTTDPEGEQLSYFWDWGDGTGEWTDPQNSGEIVYASHVWNASGEYEIRVKAKDPHDEESEWSNVKIIYIVDTAVLEVSNITGSLLKVSATIKNIGGVEATMVDWSITFDGGLIIIGKETSDRIVSIPAGGEVTVSSDLIFGFGRTVITATAECAEGSSDTKTRDAFVLLFFIL